MKILILLVSILLSTCVLSENQGPLFVDVTEEIGIQPKLESRQTILRDFDGNGTPDILFVNWEASPTTITYYSNENGKMIEGSTIGASFGEKAFIKFADNLLGDGKLIAIVRAKMPNIESSQLYFYSVEKDSATRALLFIKLNDPKLPILVGPLTDVQLFDYNRDGALDIVVGGYYLGDPDQDEYAAMPLVLLENQSYKEGVDQYFLDVSRDKGISVDADYPVETFRAAVPTYNLSICDITGDGRPEILVAGYGRRWNKLLWNRGGRFFENQAPILDFHGDNLGDRYFRGNGNSFTSSCADADNDGDLDVFQGEISHKWAGPSSDLSSILWNNYPHPFERDLTLPRPEEFGNQGDLSSMWGDIDLDGLQDLMIANSDYPDETTLLIWRQSETRKFVDWTKEIGKPFVNPKGAVLIDIDQDGDLDIVSSSTPMRGNENPYVRIYKNQATERFKNHAWIQIELVGDGECVTTFPIGTRVKITLENGETLVRELTMGYGQDYQATNIVHFGLGAVKKVKNSVNAEIRWPDGTTNTRVLKYNKKHTIVFTSKQEETTCRR